MHLGCKRLGLIRQAALITTAGVLAALGSAAVITPAMASSARPQAISSPGQDSHAKTWTEALPRAACSALHRQNPEAAPNCKVQYYVTGEKGLPVPAGTHVPAAKAASASAASAPYYEYEYTFNQCNTGAGGCSIWKVSLEIQGDYNGSYVYQWNKWCTPSGQLVANTVTWCGYSGNGGEPKSGWPVHAMTFGDNSHASGSIAGVDYNWEGGQRVWVDVYGTWFDHSTF
jgi:hypothetical protein